MAKDIGSATNPPLPTRNLSRLVANVKAIAERRKRQQQHQLLSGSTAEQHGVDTGTSTSGKRPTEEDTASKSPSSTAPDLQRPSAERDLQTAPSDSPFQPTGPLDETVANPEGVVRYKGRLPCEVSLAELTAEFRALSVVSEKRQKEIQAETINSQWRQFMVPNQMRVSPAQDEAAEDLSGAQTRQNDPSVRPAIPASGSDSFLVEPVAGGVLDPSWNWTTPRLTGRYKFKSQTSSPLAVSGASLTGGNIYTPVVLPWFHQSADVHHPQKKTSWAALAAPSPMEQKQMLGERLFPLIQTMYPDLAGKITGMLLEIDNKELLRMLESEESLKVKVEEAVAVLQAHQAKDQAAVTVKKEAAMRVSSHGVRKGPVSTVGYGPLTADMLAAAPPQEQKQMLGERLFPLIQTMYPDLAGKITGVLLEIDNTELLRMLESEESLKVKVEEAVAVLQTHQAKEQASVTVKKEVATRLSSGAVRKGQVSTVEYEPLTADMLAAAPPQEQKQMLGERLFPLIQSMYPDLARNITGMLLEMDNKELLRMLRSEPSLLRSKVEEAVAMLQAHGFKVSVYAGATAPTTATATATAAAAATAGAAVETRAMSITRAMPILGQVPATAASVVAAPLRSQREVLGTYLFPLVEAMCTDRTLASVLTGMLLELDAAQVLLMLRSKEVLVARVTEAYTALQRHHQTQAFLSAANVLQTAVSAEACVKVDENEGVAAIPKQEPPPTADVLEALSAEERNDMLSERLFPKIQRMHPDLAGKITKILLGMDDKELLLVLESQELLKAKVQEAVAVLQDDKAKEDDTVDEEERQRNELAADEEEKQRDKVAIHGEVKQRDKVAVDEEDVQRDNMAIDEEEEQRDKVAIGGEGEQRDKVVIDGEEEQRDKVTIDEEEKEEKQRGRVVVGEEVRKSDDEDVAEKERQPDNVGIADEKRSCEDVAIADEERQTDDVAIADEEKQTDDAAIADKERQTNNVAIADEEKQTDDLAITVEKRQTDDVAIADEKRQTEDVAIVREEKSSDDLAVAEVGRQRQSDDLSVAEERGQRYDVAPFKEEKRRRDDEASTQREAGIGQDGPVNVDTLDVVPPQVQKQTLIRCLFPLVHHMYPDLTEKIMAILSELDNPELLRMLQCQETLTANVLRAFTLLQVQQDEELLSGPETLHSPYSEPFL